MKKQYNTEEENESNVMEEESLTLQEEEELKNMMKSEQEKRYEGAKAAYDSIPISSKLDRMVRETIRNQSVKHQRAVKRANNRRRLVMMGRTFGTMAAAALLFMIPLNTSQAFAAQMRNVPVIKVVAQVLTVRSYDFTEEDTHVEAEVPEIVVSTDMNQDIAVAAAQDEQLAAPAGDTEAVAVEEPEIEYMTETTDVDPQEPGMEPSAFDVAMITEYTGNINDEIQAISESYIADAQVRFEEYKEAFFITGGTEEEWADRTCDIAVSYDIKFNEGAVLSLVLTTTEEWNASYGEQHYFNLDLANATDLTLADMLGEDWMTICNEVIVSQMYERAAADSSYTYWGYSGDEEADSIEGFTTVNEDTNFYINEAGNPVVCFSKYEIAPGFMGTQEFEITVE